MFMSQSPEPLSNLVTVTVLGMVELGRWDFVLDVYTSMYVRFLDLMCMLHTPCAWVYIRTGWSICIECDTPMQMIETAIKVAQFHCVRVAL
jgi:hypothetical protein